MRGVEEERTGFFIGDFRGGFRIRDGRDFWTKVGFWALVIEFWDFRLVVVF